MHTHNFEYPGFSFIEDKSTPAYLTEVGEVVTKDRVLVLTVLQNKKFLDKPFLLTKATCGQKLVWRYQKDEHADFYGTLAKAEGEVVVALVGKVSGGVERVISLTEEVAPDSIQCTGPARNVLLKVAAAKFLDCSCHLTLKEKTLQRIAATTCDLDNQGNQATKKLEVEERAVKAREKRTKIDEILSRGKISCETSSGRRRGTPVVEDEWEKVPDKTSVVLVSSYEDGVCGEIQEYFVVGKKGGKPRKKGKLEASLPVVPVNGTSETKTNKKLATVPVNARKKLSFVLKSGKNLPNVPAFNSADEVRGLKEEGVLEPGVIVCYPCPTLPESFMIVRVEQGHIDTVGQRRPL